MNIDMWKAQIESGTVEEKREAIRAAKDFPIEQVVDTLIKLLYEDNKAIQEAVIEFLMDCSDDIVVERLLPLLKEEDANVRNAAIEILEKIGRDKVDIIGRYLDDEDKDVRLFVCDIIGKFGTEKALDYLIKALNDPEVNVRNSAVMGIGKVQSNRAVEALSDLLSREEDTWVRFSVIDSLTHINLPLAKKVLRDALYQEKNELVLKALLDAIAKFGGEDFVYDAMYVFEFLMTRKLSDIYSDIVDLGLRVDKIEDEKLVYKFAVYLCAYIKYAEDRWTAYRAVNVLPKLSCCAEKILLDVLSFVQEPMIVASAIEGLGQVGTSESIPVLERFLSSEDERQRELAQEAIDKINSRK